MSAFKQWAEELEQRARVSVSCECSLSVRDMLEDLAERERIMDAYMDQFRAWWESRDCVPPMYVDAMSEFMDKTFRATPESEETSKW